MASLSAFNCFPLLPFEIRDMIWHEAAKLPMTRSQGKNLDVAWDSGTPPDNVELARGTILTYREQGARPPAIAQACSQARDVAMKHNELRIVEIEDSSLELRWNVRRDVVLLAHVRPRALLGNRKHLAKIARETSCLAIPLAHFTKPGSIPMYLFEVMRAMGKCASYPPMIVGFEFTVRRWAAGIGPWQITDSSEYGTSAQEPKQLVNVKNRSLLSTFAALELVPRRSYDPLSSLDRLVRSRASWEKAVKVKLLPVEDMWLDCQFPAVELLGASGSDSVLAPGAGSRYNRQHQRVQEALQRMPQFEVAVMFNVLPALDAST